MNEEKMKQLIELLIGMTKSEWEEVSAAVEKTYATGGHVIEIGGRVIEINSDVIRRQTAERYVNEYKLLAEVICKYCTEKQLTQQDVMLAVSIVLKKFFNDATI